MEHSPSSLSLSYNLQAVGMDYDRAMFGMKLADCRYEVFCSSESDTPPAPVRVKACAFVCVNTTHQPNRWLSASWYTAYGWWSWNVLSYSETGRDLEYYHSTSSAVEELRKR